MRACPKLPLGRGTLLATLAVALPFASPAQPASPFPLAAAQAPAPATAASFAGTWHWVLLGKPFATLTLVPSGTGVTGSLTNAHIALGDDGKVTEAEADPGNSPIIKSVITGSVLHFTVKHGDDTTDWSFTVTGPGRGEIRLQSSGASSAFPVIPAERVHQP